MISKLCSVPSGLSVVETITLPADLLMCSLVNIRTSFFGLPIEMEDQSLFRNSPDRQCQTGKTQPCELGYFQMLSISAVRQP